MDWYVYVLIDPVNKCPFYVGKGRGRRCFWHLRVGFDPNWRKRVVIASIRASGKEPIVRYAFTGLTEAEAFAAEIKLIARYGRRPSGLLTNMSDGGEGQSGFKPSLQTRDKIAAAMRGSKNHFFGKHHRPEALVKIGAVNRGKRLGRQWRKRLSIALAGRAKSLEHRMKIALALKGRTRSRLHAQHLAEANRGKVLSAQTRAKLSAVLRGKKKSAETKKRMSEGMKRFWSSRR